MLKIASKTDTLWMTDVCYAVVKDDKIPEDWSRSWMVNVYKGERQRVMHSHLAHNIEAQSMVHGGGNSTSLLLKRFPDSSGSSIILVGWWEEGYPATKNFLQHSQG